jgi:hypothetical protein
MTDEEFLRLCKRLDSGDYKTDDERRLLEEVVQEQFGRLREEINAMDELIAKNEEQIAAATEEIDQIRAFIAIMDDDKPAQ